MKFVTRLLTRFNRITIKIVRNQSQNVIPAPYKNDGCKRLQDKIAVLTASTDGIGFAIAERFCQEGAKVIISSRSSENVDKAVKKLQSSGHNVIGVPCHVGKDDQRRRLLDTALENYGGVDILVSNAAVNPTFLGLLECSEKAWDKIFEINVTSSLAMAQLFAPHMRKRESDCSMLFVSSFVGLTVLYTLSAYSVSKTALIGMMRALAYELAETNIRANSLAPGNVLTKFSDPKEGLMKMIEAHGIVDSEGKKDKIISTFNDQTVKHIPMNRSAEPYEMAGAAAFLCSQDASYITGEVLCAAGGIFTRL